MKKKVALCLFVVGVIMILLSLLLNNNSKNDNSNPTKEISLINDGVINCDCSDYELSNHVEEYFYSVDSSKNKYSFLLPAGEVLRKITNVITEYNGVMNIRYGDDGLYDEDIYFNNYINDLKSDYDKLNVKKQIIDSDTFAIITRALNSSSNNYFEEIIIYSHNLDDDYSYVDYKIQNTVLSNNTINKIINGFKREEKKAEYTSCEKQDNQYVCSINIKNIGKKIDYKVDATKYLLIDEVKYDNYRESFSLNNENSNDDEDDEISIYVGILLSEALDNDLINTGFLANYRQDKISINGKQIDKYVNESDNSVRYLFRLDDNIAIVLGVLSDNPDEVAQDFANFSLSDM